MCICVITAVTASLETSVPYVRQYCSMISSSYFICDSAVFRFLFLFARRTTHLDVERECLGLAAAAAAGAAATAAAVGAAAAACLALRMAAGLPAARLTVSVSESAVPGLAVGARPAVVVPASLPAGLGCSLAQARNPLSLRSPPPPHLVQYIVLSEYTLNHG